jgi:hypothetical protein
VMNFLVTNSSQPYPSHPPAFTHTATIIAIQAITKPKVTVKRQPSGELYWQSNAFADRLVFSKL